MNINSFLKLLILTFVFFIFPVLGVDSEPVKQDQFSNNIFTVISSISALLGSLGGSYAIIGKYLKKFTDNQEIISKEIKDIKNDVQLIKSKK